MTDVDWLPAEAADGHRWKVLNVRPRDPVRSLLWLPALGVAARHYEPFARALAAHGIAVYVHEWRGLGSSALRASRASDWGYRELLLEDIPRSRDVAAEIGLPLVAGGHSLGGQLATCAGAIHGGFCEALWLVASGSPWPRAFPQRTARWLPLAYRLLRLIASANGTLPGRRLGFGGTEARSVIRDWSATALTGRYAAPGVGDLEPGLRNVDVPVRAAVLADDWLAPPSSLQYLLGKTGSRDVQVELFDDARTGARADHFAWMKAPEAIAHFLAGGQP